MSPPVLDVDDVATWGPDVTRAVDAARSQVPSAVEDTVDVPLDSPGVAEILATLVGVRVRVFHATRLLPHEVDEIRTGGLSTLSVDLQTRKLEAAHAHGYLSAQQVEQLAATTALRGNAEVPRAGQLWASASRRPFDRSPSSVRHLLTHWGGEGLYWAHERTELGDHLRSLGTPSLVRFTVPVDPDAARWTPGLAQLLVGVQAGFDDVGADVRLLQPAPATAIEAVLQPGQAEYDAHARLPRS